jgi:hypothetical protein
MRKNDVGDISYVVPGKCVILGLLFNFIFEECVGGGIDCSCSPKFLRELPLNTGKTSTFVQSFELASSTSIRENT